jgi:hypothetical protein
VKSVAEAVSNRKRIEADAVVERAIESSLDAFARTHVRRHDVVPPENLDARQALEPGRDVLVVDEEDGCHASRERSAKLVDDPAFEEDTVGNQIREDDPDLPV